MITKEIYNELVNKGFITDTFLTFDKIVESNMKLEDIVTQPAAYNYFIELMNNVEVVTKNPITVKESEIIEITEVDETDIPSDATILEYVEVVEESVEKTTEEVTEETNIEVVEESVEKTTEETNVEIVVDDEQ